MKKIKNYRCDCGIYFDSSADFEDMKILCPDCYASLEQVEQVESVDIKILEKFKFFPNDHIEGFNFHFSNMQYLQNDGYNIGVQFKSHCGIVVNIYINNTIHVCGGGRVKKEKEQIKKEIRKIIKTIEEVEAED